jgi:hypothetical protein
LLKLLNAIVQLLKLSNAIVQLLKLSKAIVQLLKILYAIVQLLKLLNATYTVISYIKDIPAGNCSLHVRTVTVIALVLLQQCKGSEHMAENL